MIIDNAILTIMLVIAGLLAAICFFMLAGRIAAKKKLPLAFAIFAAVCVLFGSDKSIISSIIFYQTDPEIKWLADKGSYVSNDVVHVSWAPHAQLPDSAILQMWHCPTNNAADPSAWVQYGADVAVVDCPRQFDIIYTNALEFAWLFMTTYVRPPIDIDNKFYTINCIIIEDSSAATGVPIHTEIQHNDETIKNYTESNKTTKE